MFEKEIEDLKIKCRNHIYFQILMVLLLPILGVFKSEFIMYALIIIFIAEIIYFEFYVLRCPGCKKLLRNPLKPRILHLPEKCKHCDLKIY